MTRLRVALGVAVVGLLAATPAGLAAPRHSAATGPVQFTIGTYTLAGSSTLGTLWGWHTSSASDVAGLGLANLAITGPTGWNGGVLTNGCAVFRGMAPTVCIGWKGAALLAGQYSAKGSVGQWFATAITSSRIDPPTITKASRSGGTVAIAWAPVGAAQSYIVAVTPAASTTCCDVANEVLPAAATSYTFRGLALKKGRAYRVAVFALSSDVSKDQPLNVPFNIGEARKTLGSGGGGGSTGGGAVPWGTPIHGQVHGAARIGSSTLQIVDLRVEGLPANTVVTFRCLKGCSITDRVAGSGTVHARRLRGATLPNGAVIEVRAVKTPYTGFYDRLVLHTNPVRFFTETKMCLSPSGGSPPHVCKNGR